MSSKGKKSCAPNQLKKLKEICSKFVFKPYKKGVRERKRKRGREREKEREIKRERVFQILK